MLSMHLDYSSSDGVSEPSPQKQDRLAVGSSGNIRKKVRWADLALLSARQMMVLIFICTFLFGFTNLAVAQDWRFEPVLKVGGEFDDNATLSIITVDEVELDGYLLDLRADINYTSPKSKLFVQPRVLLRNYPDEPDFESDDLFLRSRYSYKGASNDFGFFGQFDRQSVRTAERTDSDLEIDDPDEIQDNSSGRLLRFGTRDLWRIVPFWEYELSNTSSIKVTADYVDVQYDNQISDLLLDYSDTRLEFGYRRAFSSITNGVITLTGRTYNSEDSISDLDGLGFLIGLEHALSQNTSIVAMVGLEDTDTIGPDTDPELVGFATLTRSLETIRLFAQYRRTISATGVGQLSVRDSVNLNFKRRLSEKVRAGLGIRAYQSRGIGGAASIDDRNYVQLQSSFTWYLAQFFAIELDYRYTVNDRSDVLGERANSNRINVWFIYQPNTVPRL
jgi:hypothetical protein